MQITCYGGVNKIGGNKILVKHNDTRVFLDFGRNMGEAGQFYEEYIKPRSKCVVLDLLKLGILPDIDNIYPAHLLDYTTLAGQSFDPKTKLPWSDAKDYWKNNSLKPYSTKDGINAVFISHAHFDHIQDVSFIHKEIPIYTTETTKVLAKAITDVSKSDVENQFYRLKDNIAMTKKNKHPKTAFSGELTYKETSDLKNINEPKIGCLLTREIKTIERNYITKTEGEIKNINYKIIPVGHSVPGACSILLTTSEGKRILYTGDIRFSGSNEPSMEEYLEEIGKKPIDVMICEGTRVDNETMLSEEDVYQSILNQIDNTKGLLLVDFGWKDTTRFETILKAAKKTRRIFVINPKLAYLLFELHMMDEKRYEDPRKMENVKVYKKRQGDCLYAKNDYKKFEAGYLEYWGRYLYKEDLSIVKLAKKKWDVCTEYEFLGGEPIKLTPEEEKALDLATSHIENGVTAYEIRKNPNKYILMFNFWNANELFDLSNAAGEIPNSTYIRASCEPFSDEMEIDEEKMMNWLNKFGVEYLSDEKNGKKTFKRAHVSGHISRPELKELIEKINPKTIIPIHTEKPKIFFEIVGEIGTEIKVILPEYGKTYSF